ncbi:MAG: hypothetical protein ABSD31_17360 [Candidatus Binataceae bacterium]
MIYYYYNEPAPVYLLTVYAKSKRADLSEQEKSLFKKVVAAIKTQIRERQVTQRQRPRFLFTRAAVTSSSTSALRLPKQQNSP